MYMESIFIAEAVARGPQYDVDATMTAPERY